MKTSTLLNAKIQVFSTVNDKTPCQLMSVGEVLEFGKNYKELIDKARRLYDTDTDAYRKTKMRMFAWLPSTLCGKDKSNVVHTYPVMSIDIDGKDNPDVDVEELKERLIGLPFIYYAGLSIGGKGVFALALIDDPTYYEEHFHAMEDYMRDNLGVVIDPQCSNSNRLRYVSYDDNPRIKDLDDIVEPFKELKWDISYHDGTPLQMSLFTTKKTDLKRGEDLISDDRFCYCVIDYCIDKLHYQSGKRTGGWLQDLSICKSLGVAGEELAVRISRQSPGYVSDNDVLKTFNHRKTFVNRQGMTKFFMLCRDHFKLSNRHWIYAIKEIYELD